MNVQLATLLTDRISPTGTLGARPAGPGDGVDITLWRAGLGAYSPREAIAELTGTADATLSPLDAKLIAAGIELWGLINGHWRFFAPLAVAGANPKVIAGPEGGIAIEVDDVAAATRLCLAGTASAGVVSYKFTPLETTR